MQAETIAIGRLSSCGMAFFLLSGKFPFQAANGSLPFFHHVKRSFQRSEEHTSELQSRQYLHSFPTRRSSDLCRCPLLGTSPPPCGRRRWKRRLSACRQKQSRSVVYLLAAWHFSSCLASSRSKRQMDRCRFSTT